MYLDMIHEKIAELKGVAQYLDWKKGIRTPVSPLSPAAPPLQGKGAPAFKGAPPLSPVRREPSANQLIGTAGCQIYRFQVVMLQPPDRPCLRFLSTVQPMIRFYT